MFNKYIHILFLLLATTIYAGTHVHKHILDNGLTILIRPVNTAQKVSTQLWFNVGSKHEADDQKGLAHWLEHMCFKGTQRMSETDIRLTAAKLSGGYNATTSYDWTRYYLNFPVQHWHEALPILADIMCNCTFKQDLLNAELQVVIQEMKNNRDNFVRQLAMQMMAAIFPDHPYHYPVIGYRSDLEALSRDKLMAFYKKHYIPNNAVLVIVGNVDPDDVVKKVTTQFGHIKPDWSYRQKDFCCQEDICAKAVTLYRHVQKPHLLLAFRIPGAKDSNAFLSLEILKIILSGGQGSRLQKKLVDQEKLVNNIGVFSWHLADHDLLVISCEPHEHDNVDRIIDHIQDELGQLATHGPELDEIKKAVLAQESGIYDSMEHNHQQASGIAQSYLTTEDEDFIFNYIHHEYEKIKQDIKAFVHNNLRPAVMHTGIVLPLPEHEKTVWQRLQDNANAQDALLLQNKMRQSPVEPGKYVHTISSQDPAAQNIPKPETLTLSNGLKVLYYHNDNLPKVQVGLRLKFDGWYEPQDKPPLCKLLKVMLLEGTTTRTKEQLIKEFEQDAIMLAIKTGSFSMNILKEHAHKAFELLTDVICNPRFDNDALEKHKKHALYDYHNFWDSPRDILACIIGKNFYGDFYRDHVGTPETITNITVEDLKAFHAKYYSPHEATLVLVGNLSDINISQLLEQTIGTWQGPAVEDREFFEGTYSGGKEITHTIDREQVMLAFAGLSVNRFHKDFYPLILFDTVFNKKLFSLREQTNAFYWIHGSVAAHTGKQEPGEVFIKTQVSQTRVQEAQELILAIVDHIADTFDEQDLIEAQNHLINSISDQYSTNGSIGSTFLFLDKFDLPNDYLISRIPKIKNITVEQVRAAVKRVLNKENLSVFKVGPV